MKTTRLTAVLALALALSNPLRAQDVALKTNLLYDATLTANLGIEVALAPQWTLDLSANLNAWQMPSDILLKHFLLQPEVRYWLCNKFSGHFLALHAHAGAMNVGHFGKEPVYLGHRFYDLDDLRAEGWFVGGGIAYGYDWVLSRHWNIEAEIGLGYTHFTYDKLCYDCHYGDCSYCGDMCMQEGDCKGVHSENNHYNYFGITKLALSIVYLF